MTRSNPCYIDAADFGGLDVETGLDRYFRGCSVPSRDGTPANGLCVININ